MNNITQWSKGALIGAAPSPLIRTKKDSHSYVTLFELSMAGSGDVWKLLCVVKGSLRDALFEVTVTKSIQPPLDVSSRNAELPFSGTNSVVSSVQNNALLLFFSVLASNGLHTRLLTVYRCRLNILELPVVGQRLAVTFQWALSWPPYRTLYRLLPTFGRCRLKQSSDVVFYTNTAEVILQGRYLARSKHTRAHEGDFPYKNLGAV